MLAAIENGFPRDQRHRGCSGGDKVWFERYQLYQPYSLPFVFYVSRAVMMWFISLASTLLFSNTETLSISDLNSSGQFHILSSMQWIIGGLILAAVAGLLRRILRMDATAGAQGNGAWALRPHLQTIYAPFAQEIEALTAILGITLNDAFGEREANRHEMAWRVVRLAVGEWGRLTELIVGLQTILAKFVPTTNGIVPVRRVAAGHFKSTSVMDHVRLYEFLDQILFSYKGRFTVQLRLLLRASALLSKEFRHTCREGERSLDSSDEVWARLDYYFHDFDLIAKETLLALRTLLACQSPGGVQELASELHALLARGVRVSVSPSNR